MNFIIVQPHKFFICTLIQMFTNEMLEPLKRDFQQHIKLPNQSYFNPSI
jgi:hypothetical protein